MDAIFLLLRLLILGLRHVPALQQTHEVISYQILFSLHGQVAQDFHR